MNEDQIEVAVDSERAKLISKVNSEIKKSALSRKEALKRQGIARRKIEDLLTVKAIDSIDSLDKVSKE